MRKAVFYCCYSVLIAHNMLRSVVFLDESVNNTIYLFALILLSVITFFNLDKTNPKKVLLIVVATIGLALSAYLTRDIFLLTIWLVILSFKDMSIEKTLKFDLSIKTCLLLFVVLMYQLGLTNSGILFDNGVARYGMGFENPNVFSSYVMSILLEILYLDQNKHKILDLLLTIGSMTLIYCTAGSRTQIIIIILSYLLFVVGEKRLRLPTKKAIKFICENIFAIMALLSVVTVGAYTNNPYGMRNMDIALSGRLHISANVIDSYGISFFDTDSNVKELNDSTIDNQYIYVLVTDGILLLIAIYWFFNRYLVFLSKEEKVLIYYLMIILIAAGLVEKIGLRAQYNTFLLFASEMIYGNFSSFSGHMKMIKKGDKNE